ncbi:hypothetical protein DM794_01700 [Paenarthrobacter ureafaciens]|uniref:N-6 DNA methylase n=1 Tax=Paenarthrobacter ureafaciens TaxID=37931 RepID=UPI0015BA2700|nr:hypothetical protein [Paenarthrobacter ureafaciens]
MNIARTVKAVQEIMRQDVGVDGDAQRLGQLVWMLFLKILDDKEFESEAFDPAYESPIPEKLRWRNWAANDEGLTGDALKQFIDTELFVELQSLGLETPTSPLGLVVRGMFTDSFNYMKSGQLIRQVVNRLQQDIDMNHSRTRHTFGDIYEQLLRSLQSAGNAGEFYTPRAVTDFVIDRLDPKLQETVIDPACGTGGFLSGAIEHKRAHYVHTAEDESAIDATITGIEKKPLPHALATTNMILHGIEVPSQIRRDNTLAKPLISWGRDERFDVIAANPPFGGTEELGVENNFPAEYRSRETADLFMALFMKILKPGGRAGIVLPDGFLFGEGVKTRLKERLLEEFNLHTIVRLPNGVFNPYTGIKTNLLFFTKGTPTREVWFYEHPYPSGYKNYSRTRPMRSEEFEPERAWWGTEDDGFAARVETEQAWRVSIEDIRARGYNLDIRNPHTSATAKRDPHDLLAEYRTAAAAVESTRGQLRYALVEATTGSISDRQQNNGTPGENWQLLAEHFDMLFTTRSSVDSLEKKVLQLAVLGKLVPQLESEEPAFKQLSQIRNDPARTLGRNTGKTKVVEAVLNGDRPYATPAGWEWVRLGAITSKIGSGSTPTGGKNAYVTSGVPFLRSQNVWNDGLRLDDVAFIPPEIHERMSGTQVQPGDILFNITGASIGRSSLVPEDWESGNVSQHVSILRMSLPSMRPFIHLVMQSPLVQAAVQEAQVGISREGLSKSRLERFIVPVPPLAEQERIVVKVKELLALCADLKVKLSVSHAAQAHLAEVLTA